MIFYQTGDFPEAMKEIIDLKSKAAGLDNSRLPKFTDAEKTMVKGQALLQFTIFLTRIHLLNNLNEDNYTKITIHAYYTVL